MQRASGILLHPTALPGPFRIGEMGKEARLFIDFLAKAGQSVWQILPLGPTGYGHSPYNALSAFAGNPVLIDLQQLVDCGDLDKSHLEEAIKNSGRTDFNQLHTLKSKLLRQAGQQFFLKQEGERHRDFDTFCGKQSGWLQEFTLFMALRDKFAGREWSHWPKGLRDRKPTVLEEWRSKLEESCRLYEYQQFVFSEQWHKLKTYANANNVTLLGDLVCANANGQYHY